jgi:hypothetical protein
MALAWLAQEVRWMWICCLLRLDCSRVSYGATCCTCGKTNGNQLQLYMQRQWGMHMQVSICIISGRKCAIIWLNFNMPSAHSCWWDASTCGSISTKLDSMPTEHLTRLHKWSQQLCQYSRNLSHYYIRYSGEDRHAIEHVHKDGSRYMYTHMHIPMKVQNQCTEYLSYTTRDLPWFCMRITF